MGLHRPARGVRQLHAQAVARGVAHAGPRRPVRGDHGAQRGGGGVDPRRRSRDRHRRLPGHDRARVGARRLARHLRDRDRGRHPGADLADLARREVVRVHPGDRAPLRQQPPAERAGPVRLLRPRRRLHHHGQRGRRQALRHEHPLLAPAPGLRHPAAGRLGLAGRGRPRPELPRPRIRRARERLHQPEHDLPDLEPAAPRAHAEGRRRRARRTGTSARPGTPAVASTSRTRTTARPTLLLRGALAAALADAPAARADRLAADLAQGRAAGGAGGGLGHGPPQGRRSTTESLSRPPDIAAARASSRSRSRLLRVMAAARSSSARASAVRPSLASRSPRALGSRW